MQREHANFDIQTKVFPALVRRGIQVPQNYGPTFTELQRRLGRIHQLVTEATNCSGVEQHNKLKEAWARLVAYTNLLLIGLRAEVEDVSFLIRKHLSVAEAKKIFRASFEEALGETSFKGFVELLGMSFAGIHRLPARKCLTNFKAQHLSLPQRLFIVSFVIPRWRANFLRPLQKMSKEYSKDINGTTRDLAFFTAMGNVFRKKNAVGPESRTVRGAK